MNQNHQETQKIIRLKRHEKPSDDYFEEFLSEFHCRQRQDLLQRSSLGLFIERISTWFSSFDSSKLIYGAGAAYAGLMVAILMWPKGEREAGVPADFRPASMEIDQFSPAIMKEANFGEGKNHAIKNTQLPVLSPEL